MTTDLGTIMDEISQLQPAECILPEDLYQRTDLLQVLHSQKTMNIFPYSHFPKQISDAEKILKKHFGVATLKGFDIPETSASLIPAAALITYLTDTQNGNIPHIKKIVPYASSDGMILDRSTMINLELF